MRLTSSAAIAASATSILLMSVALLATADARAANGSDAAASGEDAAQVVQAEEAAPASSSASAGEASARQPLTDDRVAKESDGGANAEHLRIGVVGGVGFPRPLSIEAMLKFERVLSLGLEYSAMPSTSVGGVMVGWHALALDARIFPFQGAFFLGARVARQHLDGSATVNAGAYGTYSGAVTMDTWYLEPRLGFLWTFRSGITVGLDAGLEMPLQKSSTASLPAGIAVPSTVATVRDFFGASTLPTVTLLSVGALF